jgi:hypothetical protein
MHLLQEGIEYIAPNIRDVNAGPKKKSGHGIAMSYLISASLWSILNNGHVGRMSVTPHMLKPPVASTGMCVCEPELAFSPQIIDISVDNPKIIQTKKQDIHRWGRIVLGLH